MLSKREKKFINSLHSFIRSRNNKAQGHLAKKVSQGKFSNWILGRQGRVFSYGNHQLIKFEEEKRFEL